MTDHQQAAIEAAMKKLLPRFLGQSRTRCEDSVIQALAAAEPHLRRKWAEELVERIGASNLGAPLRIYPDGTAHIASGPEMRALLCEFILEGVGE